MKKFFINLFKKMIQKIVKKSVTNEVEEVVPEVVPETVPEENSKKVFWRYIIQALITILTAIAATLGTTSCIEL